MKSEREILDDIAKQLQEMREKGLEDTDEYEGLSEEWQIIALNILEGGWLGEEE